MSSRASAALMAVASAAAASAASAAASSAAAASAAAAYASTEVSLSQLTLSDTGTLCDYVDCRKPVKKVLQCAKCKGVAYCSKDCQIKAWKAGHKGDCAAAACAGAGTRTAAKPTADQMRVLVILKQLAVAADWRGVAAQERAAKAVAAAVRISMPCIASTVYLTLGIAYNELGDYAKAIAYHTQNLAIAKEVGNRVGEGVAYGNLSNAYRLQGDFSKAIEYHTAERIITWEIFPEEVDLVLLIDF